MKQNDEIIWKAIDGNIDNKQKIELDKLLASDKSINATFESALLLDVVLKKAMNPQINLDFVARLQKNIGAEFAIINESVWSKKDTIATAAVCLIGVLLFVLMYGKKLSLSLSNTSFEMNPNYMTATLVLLAGSILMLSDKLYEQRLMKK